MDKILDPSFLLQAVLVLAGAYAFTMKLRHDLDNAKTILAAHEQLLKDRVEDINGLGGKLNRISDEQGRHDERIKSNARDLDGVHRNLHEIRTLIGYEKGAREEADEVRRA